MRVLLAVCLLLAVCSSNALPSYMRFRSGAQKPAVIKDYQAPGPGAVRSPCPILNTLANHGVLPRDGKGITEQMLSKAFQEALGASSQFGGGFAKVAFAKFMKYKKTVDPAATSITLADLALPFEKGGISHNASLSRPDVKVEIDMKTYVVPKPDAKRIEAALNHVKKQGDAVLEMKDLAAIRKFIATLSKPNEAPLIHQFIGAAEICLLRGAGYGKNGLTAKWYRTFLVDEKFPEGYETSQQFLGFGFMTVGKCVVDVEARDAVATLKDKIKDIPYFGGAPTLPGK